MKRIIAALLAGLCLLTLAGCSAGKKTGSSAPKNYSQILHDARSGEENETDMIFTKGEDGKFTAIDGYSAEYEAGQLDDEIKNMMLPLLNLEDDMYTDLAASVSSMMVRSYAVAIVKPAEGKTDAVKSALEAYVNDYFDYLESTTSDNLQDVLADCGFPVEPTSSFARGFSAGYAIGAAASPFDSARENILNALDTLGDIELTAYVSGGYLCGVDWSPSDDEYSSDMLLSIRTGGKNHTDYFSLSFENYGSGIFLESSGNHSAKGGTFTDSTYMEADGTLVFEWECSYAPKRSGNNFSASLHVPAAYPEVLLSLDGRIESDSKTLNIDMGDIFIDVDGSSGNLSFAYVLSSFDKSFDIGSPVMILDLDQSELMALAADLSSKFIPYEDLFDEMF